MLLFSFVTTCLELMPLFDFCQDSVIFSQAKFAKNWCLVKIDFMILFSGFRLKKIRMTQISNKCK